MQGLAVVARAVERADERADARAGDDVDRDLVLLEHLDRPDVGEPSGAPLPRASPMLADLVRGAAAGSEMDDESWRPPYPKRTPVGGGALVTASF